MGSRVNNIICKIRLQISTQKVRAQSIPNFIWIHPTITEMQSLSNVLCVFLLNLFLFAHFRKIAIPCACFSQFLLNLVGSMSIQRLIYGPISREEQKSSVWFSKITSPIFGHTSHLKKSLENRSKNRVLQSFCSFKKSG